MPQAKPLTIFFSVGEPSGDLHGANLIRQLRERCPDIQAVGYGGPKMAEAGCQLHADLTSLAVMWFARALLNLHKFLALGSRADRYFRHHRPDAVVLIDYPGFNWWIARRAKFHGIPVFYYSPPQIWAWARWRAKKMRRFVDHVLCGLPFEEAWLRERGCNATFVGHPFFDEVRRYPYDERFIEELRASSCDPGVGWDKSAQSHQEIGENAWWDCADLSHPTVTASCDQAGERRDAPSPPAPLPKGEGRRGPLVAILPGSRTQEVTHNLQWFLKAAAIVHQKVPGVRFALASFKTHQAEMARPMVEQSGLPIEIFVGKTPEIMRAADCAMSVSGSVSLELLYHATPTVILYWISRPAYFVQGLFRKVKYITLVNLLSADGLEDEDLTPYDPSQADADRVLFPEYLTHEDKSEQIAGHIVEWLTDPAKREARVEALRALRDRVAHGGASDRAADYILDVLGKR